MAKLLIKEQPGSMLNHLEFMKRLTQTARENNVGFFISEGKVYTGAWDKDKFQKLFEEETAKWREEYGFNGKKWVKR